MKRLSMCAESMRAILAGAKDLTTRVIVPQPRLTDRGTWFWTRVGERTDVASLREMLLAYAPYHVGERVALTEIYTVIDYDLTVVYKAECDAEALEAIKQDKERWKPSFLMPAEFSRQIVVITSVDAGRLHDMTDADYRREGAETLSWFAGDLRAAYMEWWRRLNGKRYPWDMNPWVRRFGFEREVKL